MIIMNIFIICFTLWAYPFKTIQTKKIRKIFYYRTTKSKPLQVKIIPSNAACNPDTDTPKDCDVKR